MTTPARRGLAPRLLLSACACSVALLQLAPGALATQITNPATHPDPVTVKIDGQSYHDGQDTLPGYDDEACTPIPNVEYDFADDQILYYDGDGNQLATAQWTEWSRISSYQTWVSQQAAGAGTKSAGSSTQAASGSTSSASPAASSGSAATPAAAAAATSSASTAKAATSSTAAKNSASTGSKVAATHAKHSAASGSSKSSTATKKQAVAAVALTRKAKARRAKRARHAAVVASSKPGGPSSTAGQAAGTPSTGAAAAGAATPVAAAAARTSAPGQTLNKSITSKAGRGAGNTRVAGIAILLALAAGGLVLLFGNFGRQALGRRSAKGALS